MIGRSKKLLGLTCFAISFSLFGLIWLLNHQKAAFRHVEMQVNQMEIRHLSLLEKIQCTKALCSIFECLSSGEMVHYQASLDLLKAKNFPVNIRASKTDKELRESFSAKDWLVIDRATLLKKAANVYAGASSKRAELVKEIKAHVMRYEFDQALELIGNIPVSNIIGRCRAWKLDLIKSVESKKLIKKSIIKLLSDEELAAEH